jgi:hypothetical protein
VAEALGPTKTKEASTKTKELSFARNLLRIVINESFFQVPPKAKGA